MNYDDTFKNTFACGTIPDGYSGKKANVNFSLIDGHTIVVAACGCFKFSTPPVLDVDEAIWILRNHPSSNAKAVSRLV